MMQSTSTGALGEPVAELTKFGWTLTSPESEDDLTNTLFTKSTAEDYQRLCYLDVIGLYQELDGEATV